MEIEQLKEFDNFLNEISNKISFYLVNPINVKEEKEKFLESSTYNPQFKYDSYRENIDDLKNKLQNSFINSSLIANILNQKRLEYIKKLEMISKVGTPQFANFSINVYGLPTEHLVMQSMEHVKLDAPAQNDEPVISPEEVKNTFKEAMQNYGFNWDIVEKRMIASAAVSPSKRVLYLGEGSTFTKTFIKRLIVHEIGTHALRAENGFLKEFSIFRRGFPGYMATEEGLAVMNEELSGVLNKRTLKIYGGRTIAVDMALTKSFREVFNFLKEYFDDNTAWRITLRAKRGISDTSGPGGLTKDYLYLDGYYKVKKYIENGNDINKLYNGKIGIEHVALIDQMDITGPKYLPKVI